MRSRTKRLLAILFLALGLRAGALTMLGDSFLRPTLSAALGKPTKSMPESDPDSYARFAHHLANDGVFGPSADDRSAYRPPLYSVLLAPFAGSYPLSHFGRLGIALLHLSASAVAVLLAWSIAERAGAGPWAWLAASMVAVDPLLIRQSALVMTETVFTALLLGLVAAWIKRPSEHRAPPPGCPPASRPSSTSENADACWSWRMLVGLLLGLCALTRPTAWVYWALLGVASVGRSGKHWLWCTALALAVCSPWVVRNIAALGTPILTTTHGGYTLWLGQNPVYYREVVVGPHEQWPNEAFLPWARENDRLTVGLRELAKDAVFRRQAIGWMLEDPGAALRTVVHHVWTFWRPTPTNGPSALRWSCGVFTMVLYLLALVGATRADTWRGPANALPLAPIAFTLVHAFYWSNLRMRAPIEPILAILAALGVARLLGGNRRQR